MQFNKKTGRLLLQILAVLFTAVLLFAFSLAWYWKPTIAKAIRKNIELSTNNLYSVAFKDIHINFLTGNFTNKGSLEFFGDKFPTYCVDRTYCKHMVESHSNAYFIFTYRNPYSTIYSGKYRSKLQESHSHADWFFKNLEESVKQLKTFILNWSNFIYPYVEKKIIIDYDKYVNNVDLLKADLSAFKSAFNK